MMSREFRFLALLFFPCSVAAAPIFLEDQFELPQGFRIYRAATPELSGGSYDLAFDGQGRLLVGDGNAVRRLNDSDGDGIFDSFEVIATGLGWRGPQGLLVYGNRLYAVGGDGIQLYEGYGSAAGVTHKGRIGQPFRTGGDHDAHTILRGHDGYLYFVSGDGGGVSNRVHITESNSPVMFERAASVFRISPDGRHWECVSAGGRNPPNLGQNYLGELFSFDSDMEWHVGLPWWRPVGLNHWLIGGDQGWQEVGAYPPYFIDCVPRVLDAGRGSPTWGVFYEHTQFPERYQDAFLVCDYRWKRESNDQYATSGRLVAFFLKREGAGWSATMETLARPKPAARDTSGKPISFALVDIDVAPDGSIFLSDHNQGIWRIVHGTSKQHFSQMAQPSGASPFEKLLSLPQPASEWSRLAEEDLKNQIGDWKTQLQAVALDSKRDHKERLRAVRLLAPAFGLLSESFIDSLAHDGQSTNFFSNPELRAQAAWLSGLRPGIESVRRLIPLLNNPDPFVRRRAAEAATRVPRMPPFEVIIRMDDPDRLVRFAAMSALAHHPTTKWFDTLPTHVHPTSPPAPSPQRRMRALIATKMRRELPPPEAVRKTITALLSEPQLTREDHLDLLRVLGIFREQLSEEQRVLVAEFLSCHFPAEDASIRFEQVRLLGEYRVKELFSGLVDALEQEPDHVRQFHIAQAISKLNEGWTDGEEQRLLDWFIKQQRGWFAEFSGKGVEFPQFWATVLAEFGRHHRKALLEHGAKIDLNGLLGSVYIDFLAEEPNGHAVLVRLHETAAERGTRAKIARRLAQFGKASSDEHTRIVADAFLGQPEAEVARTCAEFLARNHKQAGQEQIASAAIRYMEQHRSLFQPMANLLAQLSRTNFPVKTVEGRVDPAAREQALAAWRGWFARTFNREVAAARQNPERSDEELHRLIVARSQRGDAARGGRIYETLQCNTCHGGGVTPGREGGIFGPDLAGAARRLSRVEFADSLVYPSKQVADRFKGYDVTLKNGTTLTGFITDQNQRGVTLVERDQVRQLARKEIETITPQKSSLMPDKLLNRLSDQELADLLAFLEK